MADDDFASRNGRLYQSRHDIADVVEAAGGGPGPITVTVVFGYDEDYAEHGQDSGFYVEIPGTEGRG